PHALLERGALGRHRYRVERVDFTGEVRGQCEVHTARIAVHTLCLDECRSADRAVDDDRSERTDWGFYLRQFSCHGNVLRLASRTDPDMGRITYAVSGSVSSTHRTLRS